LTEHPDREPDRAAPAGTRRTARGLIFIGAAAVLLTNAYHLRFLEPTVSRAAVATLLFLLAAGWLVLDHYRLSSPGALLKAARRLLIPAMLLAILALAFGLRLWGIESGLPQSYVPDEYDTVHGTLQMAKRGDFNPRWWYYPSLHRYLTLLTYLGVFLARVPAGRWESLQEVQVEDMLYWGRLPSVVFGTITVLLTFLLARRLWGNGVGLMAAALLAVFPGAVEHSQFNKPDALMHSLAALSVLLVLDYLKEGGTGRALLCGLAIGLTVGAKYNGVLVLIPFLLAVAFRQGREFARGADLPLGLAGSLVGFLAACPYFLADFPRFIDHLAFDLHSYGYAGRPGAEGENNWLHHASYTFRYGAGAGASLAALAGLGLALYRLDRPLAVFLAFPVLYYSHYSSQRINWADNLIAVYPFLAALAALAVDEAARGLAGVRAGRLAPARPYLAAGVTLILLFFPLVTSVRFNRAATEPDTGNAAREWVNRAFPPGTVFAVERHAPVPDRTRFKVLIESRLISRAVADYRREGVQYLVVSSMVYERFPPEHRQSRAYAKLFEICPLVQEFAPLPGRTSGPTIRILRVPEEGPPEAQRAKSGRRS
jgi:4-amino-4-deoxy-L-arabinose transferase-like glycosyltransferase